MRHGTKPQGCTVNRRHADIFVPEREERIAAIHRASAEHQREARNTDKKWQLLSRKQRRVGILLRGVETL